MLVGVFGIFPPALREGNSAYFSLGPLASMLMLHLSLAVADTMRSAIFYDAALAPLGYERAFTQESGAGRKESAVGYGQPGAEDEFAIRLRQQGVVSPSEGFHLAFRAPSSRGSDRFPPSGAGPRRTGQRRRGLSSRTWSELLRRFGL